MGISRKKSFNYLKNIAMKNTTLEHFSQRHETFLIVDAGPEGVGAILAQQQPDQSLRPVHFASKTLTKTEQSYSHIEKKSLQFYGVVNDFIYIYMELPLLSLQIINHWKTLCTNFKMGYRITII